MKKNTKIYLGLLLPLTAIVLSTASLAATALNAALLIVSSDYDPFDVTVDGNKYTCYRLDGTGNEGKVSIAWSRDNQLPTDTPTDLNLPKNVTVGSTTYTVAGIAPGGFRYCDFQTFNFANDNAIVDIGEEAFAYCTNLTTIKLPYGIDRIAPSCFLDCRTLTHVYYSDSSGTMVINNRRITEIGDHAFDSCVSLLDFTCPREIEKFGQSCFQRCKSLTTFNFSPRKLGQGDVIENPIEIESYAFADCSDLTRMYFEENLETVHPYAFSDSNTELKFYYTGSETDTQLDTIFGNHWRDKKINNSNSSKYDVIPNQERIIEDDNYPGLNYIIEAVGVKLDCAGTNSTSIYPIPLGTQEHPVEPYAVITGFTPPPIDVNNYYDTVTKTYTIPDELGGVPVKAINTQVYQNKFQDNNKINKVVFNEHLVQIRNSAFENCYGLEYLDFSDCTDLIEISYKAFACDHNNKTSTSPTNPSKVKGLALPECLEYIGDYAFENFNVCESLTFGASPSLKTIGEFAFHRLGFSKGGKINLVLPNTLNDADTKKAKFFHNFQDSGHSKEYRYTAIGRHAFDRANGILTVTMDTPTQDQENDDNYTCSIGTSGFIRCTKLVRFVTSNNILSIGAGAFKETTADFREIYIATKKVGPSGLLYPWGCENDPVENEKYKGSIFLNSVLYNLVIYLDGKVPDSLKSDSLTGIEDPPLRWNAESAAPYVNQLNYSATDDKTKHIYSRSHIPTFEDVDWQTGGGAIYWKPNGNTIASKPNKASEYNGLVAIVKEKTTDNSNRYVIAKYYSDSQSLSTIDMANIPTVPQNEIKTIGEGAFATSAASNKNEVDSGNNAGLYIILPSGVETIEERAFYRRPNNYNNLALRAVSYRVGGPTGTIQAPTGKTFGGSDYFCMLPSSVTTIERNAFYNNRFVTIDFGGASLKFLGNAAFFVYKTDSSVATLSNLTTAYGLEQIGNSIYYTGNANRKTLLYAAANISGSYSIDAGTKAVGMRALANTQYTGVTIPSGLTTIYGGGFQMSKKLLKITGGADLKYIGAAVTSGDTEVYDYANADTMPYDNIDYRDSLDGKGKFESMFGAFKDCILLNEVDFTSMEHLKKIGFGAFYGCTDLKKSSASNTYTYETYAKVGDNSESFTAVSNGTGVNEGVLDLSQCKELTSIGIRAFYDCTSINFVHLPNTVNEAKDVHSNFCISSDPEYTTVNFDASKAAFNGSTTKILFGETPKQACPSITTYGANTRFPNSSTGENMRYYHITESSDCPSNVNENQVKYWTKSGGKYILFESRTDAQWFFSKGHTPDAVQF